MRTYRVLVIGMGKRGLHHATFFRANPRFELIGISSRDPARLQAALSKLGNVPSSGDARSLALLFPSESRIERGSFDVPPRTLSLLPAPGVPVGDLPLPFARQ